MNNEPLTTNERQLADSKNRRVWTGLTGGLISILVLSGFLFFGSRSLWHNNKGDAGKLANDSVIIDLRNRSLPQKISTLKQIATTKSDSQVSQLDRARARYLLAVQSLQLNKPKTALKYLEGLSGNYDILAPYILLKEAEAYQKLQQLDRVAQIYRDAINNYPESSVIPEIQALLENKGSEEQIDYLVANFPYHPDTQQILQQEIKQNPDRWQSLLAIATYNRQDELNGIRDRLVLEYSGELTKQNWQAIADGYWRSGEHRKAADAYRFSPPSPQNLYRTARGFHRNGNFEQAKRAYQRLIKEYHDAQETGQALIYIARLSSADEAIAYLDRAIAKFPDRVPQALLAKAIIYEAFDKPQAAKQARTEALQNYADSTAVLNYRWQKAYSEAMRGNYQGAWQWGSAIATTKSLQSEPKAIFWVGKWAQKAGKTAGANVAFENVIALHPQSYYAWRSAVMLGWDVGDFDNLREIQPSLSFQDRYEPLPIGSATLQELYLLGQYEAAWVQLQAELTNPQQLSVEEQFTEGLLLVKSGRIREGIQYIWNLGQTESPLELEKWRSLRERDDYWYGLFPFPYEKSIVTYARQEEINPLLPISVMRKESTFDPDIDSPVGAVGLMQVIPRTADWIAKQNEITDYDLTKPSDNIRLGTWYLAHNHQRYRDNSLYAIASYNAGTGNVNRWLQQFSLDDPDLFVEQIPFPETKDYVEGVFGNYWNYLRLYDPNYQTYIK
jgi:soluble lytic murein transglycosylase